MEYIREEIFVIMYNSSKTEDLHVKNISSNKILQLCEKDMNCQPRLNFQKYSCKLYFII